MEKFKNLTIFRKDKYEEIEVKDTEITVIGEIELSEEEKSILKRTPKFALPEELKEHTMKEEIEKAFCKISWEHG